MGRRRFKGRLMISSTSKQRFHLNDCQRCQSVIIPLLHALSMMLSLTHSAHLFCSWTNCLKNGMMNYSRAACGEKMEKVKNNERKKKLIFPIFLSVNQIMICWLFLLINCSTFPLICAQANTTKWNLFPFCFFFVDYSTEQLFTSFRSFINS